MTRKSSTCSARGLGALLVAGFVSLAGCSASGPAGPDGTVVGAATGTEGPAEPPGAGGSESGDDGVVDLCSAGCDVSTLEGPSSCGDGELTENEACDDGNRSSGDGCAGNCLGVDPGYSCSPPGVACHVVALCGDGIVSANEPCDDGANADGDGCSARCQLEPGYACSDQPSTCAATPCGDGERQGAETCDDGNRIPLDGCSANCTAEPDCSSGSCTSDCGDGLVIDEECDDGNSLDGDGCSSRCTREPGFECAQRAGCAEGGACVLSVPTVYRDFTAAHPDFRCGGGTPRPTIAGVLSGGKPSLLSGNPGCIASADSFAEWYTDGPGRRTIASSIALYADGSGRFVNRHGADGERWLDLNGAALDGTPVFLPLDAIPDALAGGGSVATIAPEYTGDGNWHAETDFIPGAGLHNFLFTTEVQHWFRFEEGFSAQLDFLGDDDVWVFVNGVLALDLGGLHVPEQGSVVIEAASAAAYALEPGNIYAIKIFHAERNPTGSSFKLTLTGFENTPSECTPICGDGIVSLGEECDDGLNDGGYGECERYCKAGPRCGDRVVQAGEDCDDGNRVDGDGCGSACRNVIIR